MVQNAVPQLAFAVLGTFLNVEVPAVFLAFPTGFSSGVSATVGVAVSLLMTKVVPASPTSATKLLTDQISETLFIWEMVAPALTHTRL